MTQYPIITVLCLYFAAIIGIGVYTSRLNKNLSDFVLGGRSLGSAVTALGAGASDMSGWLLLGLPGAVYSFGIHEMWMPIGLSLGAFCNWMFVAKRLRIYTEIAKDSLTIPAYFDNRFHDTSGTLRVIAACAIVVFFTFYAAAGFVSGAIVFQYVFNVDYTVALWLAAIVIISYTTLGGFLAVNWVDLFQGSLMMIALIVVPVAAIWHLGDWQETLNIIGRMNIDYLDVVSSMSWLTTISLLAWGLGYFGQPHILVRFMASKTPEHIPSARFICMNWMIISLYGAIFTGFVGIAFFADTPLQHSESVFLKLALAMFNPWIVGFLFAAILSAIMSTIAAQLLASASALTEDFYHKFFSRNPSPKKSLMISRITVLVVSLVAVMLASKPTSSVLGLVSYAWAGLGATFGPIILLSLFWPRITRNGALSGLITGAATIVIWKHLQAHGGIFALYEIVPAFFVSCLVIVLVSKLGAPPAPAIIDEFNRMKNIDK